MLSSSDSWPDERLPVHEIIRTGIDEQQAKKLAEALKIPVEKVFWRDGMALFVDSANYLAVPTVHIDHQEVAGVRLRTTTNHYPDIPIEVRAIDYEALAEISPLSHESAVELIAAALDSTGLTPEHATPIVGHSIFKTVSLAGDKGAPASTRKKLDTHVMYRFTVDGYLLVGPGAQVQVSFGPDGNVTRLVHSTRALRPGPSVKIVSADAVRERLTRHLPDEAEIRLRLVYWTPPLRPGIYSPPRWSPRVIIPWYAVTITRPVEPSTTAPRMQTSRVHLLPATDDFRFVPSVTVAATSPERSRVQARASVRGGTPPYSFLWAGANPEAFDSAADEISYVAFARDFRGVLPAQSLDRTESVSVTVVDANGVSVQTAQSVHVTAEPAPSSHSSITYGCESPNDPGPSPTDGSYAPERIAWQQAMGAPGQGGGSQRFCWLADSSWPGDYIEPGRPGSIGADPWITGDADHSNWGINRVWLLQDECQVG